MLSGGHLLSVLIFFPAAGALALMMLRGDDYKFIRAIAMLVSVAELLFSLILLRGVPIGTSGYQLEEFAKWISAPPIHYHLGADGISMFLVLLTTFLTPISVLASWSSIQHRVKEFFVMLLLLEVGVIGVFFALDMFLFFLFWELMLIPMAFLIGIWGHERRVYAAVKFVLYTMAGSILMLVGIIWLYNATGTFDLPTIQQALANGQLVLEPRTEMLLFLAFFFAFAIKVPLFPLHTWLPDAHVEAPTAGSVMLAGVLLKLGTYGMIRFCLPLFPEASHRAARWVAVLAIIGIIYGALVSMVQPNLKKRILQSATLASWCSASSRSRTFPCRALFSRCSRTGFRPARCSCSSACSTTGGIPLKSANLAGFRRPCLSLLRFSCSWRFRRSVCRCSTASWANF